MKVVYLVFFVSLFSVDAQRRSVKSELLSENEPPPKTARRGRARFTVSPETPQVEEVKRADVVSRRLVSRRKPEIHTEATPLRKGYEVDEIIDDTPIETFRKHGKTRVLTETKYEAQNAPPTNTLFQPSTTENFDEIIKSIGSDLTGSTSSPLLSSSTIAASLETSSSELITSEVVNEITRTQPEATTPSLKPAPRNNGRSRQSSLSAAPTATSRVRSRVRVVQRPEEQGTSASPRTVSRGSRRRPEPVETKSKSAVSTSEAEIPTRPRNFDRVRIPTVEATSEKVETPRLRSESRFRSGPTETPRFRAETRLRASPTSTTEFVPVPGRSRNFESRSRLNSAETVEVPQRSRRVEARSRGPSVIASAETAEVPSRTRSGRKIGGGFRRTEEAKAPEQANADFSSFRRTNSRDVIESTTARFRTRSRIPDTPPVIDEEKLEVLPLFERESKTVRPVKKFTSRRRNLNSAEEIGTSATENDVKLAHQPAKQSVVVETRTEANVRRRKQTVKPVIRGTKSTVKPTVQTTKASTTTVKPKSTTTTTTTTTTSKPTETRRPIIKESVVSEITEVTSKRTLTRAKLVSRNKVEAPKFVSRGSKKSEVNLENAKKGKLSVSSSEEDIEDSDNYPEPFKALIQAKKQHKESRPQASLVTASPAVTKTTEKVVKASPSTTVAPSTSSEAIRQLEDSENELDPSKAGRSTRRRLPQSTEKPSRPPRKSKFVRSTTAAPLAAREHKFHAKFNPEPEATSNTPVKAPRGSSPKPPRGVYSSRKTKESLAKSKSTTVQIPTSKKATRYSSRYRSDPSIRSSIRTSTNAPAYVPTIPTITPPTTLVKSSVAYQDKDLGVEVISFDDPVNTVPSANLVSGDYIPSSTENHLTSPLVSASQTKNPGQTVSIIERIINSITAISTTEAPDMTKSTTPLQDLPTKESAILKLASKKPAKLDSPAQNIPSLTLTTEKPTTVIERILSSLSAIQADNAVDNVNFKSKQVGTDFNTISSPSTTPITRVTKSSLPAQFSTSVNPLDILDEISNDQTLQKRTIDKLLVLLNTLTTPSSSSAQHSTPLVVVTPKTSYVVGNSPAAITTEPTTTTTTLATSTTSTETATTTNQLFTSPSSNFSLNARINSPQTTPVRYTTTPTYTTLSTQPPTTTIPSVTTSTQMPTFGVTEVGTTPVSTVTSDENDPLPLTVNFGVSTGSTAPSTTDSSSTIPLNTRVDSSTTSTTESSLPFSSTFSSTDIPTDTETNFVFPSTIPTLVNFNVSPGSVSVFSANDVSNAITPEDFLSSTVTIAGRTNSLDNVITTQNPTTVTNASPFNSVNTVTTQTSVDIKNRVGPETTTVVTTTASSPTTSSADLTSTLSTNTPAESTTTGVPPTTSSSPNNSSKDISSNIIDTTGSPPDKSTNTTVNAPTNSTSARGGRLLSFVQDPVQNSIETTTPSDKDYFIFAVLNNNTVLRKRPSRFPTKETPFLIVGVYPNNTIVRKFPNGTIVPMEPVIRVSGFDTRANPPPLAEITSNQVTPDQGSQPENKNLQTVEQNTIPPVEANPLKNTVNSATTTTPRTVSSAQPNPLSISSTSSTTTESSTSKSTSSSSAAPTVSSSTVTTARTTTTTIPTLSEILNGKTVQAFNSIINISELGKTQTLDVDPKPKVQTTTLPTTFSNRILEDAYPSTTYNYPTTQRPITTTTTRAPTTRIRTTTAPPTTTTYFPTTTLPPTAATFGSPRGTTVLPLSQPVTSSSFTTTTFFPQFLTTLFSTLRPRRITTEAPFSIVTAISNRNAPTTIPNVEVNTLRDLVSASSTRRSINTTPYTTTTELPTTTYRQSRRRGTHPTTTVAPETTTQAPTTTTITTTTYLPPSTSVRNVRRSTTTLPTTTTTPVTTTTNATKKLRQLTDQQRKDLETLAQLEREQAAILRQLSLLTNLNFANLQPTTDKNDLANRIIAMAVEKDKERKKTTTTTSPPDTTTAGSRRQAKKISPANESIQDIVKNLEVSTPATASTEYGKSNEAIIAALLKEQGIGPTTPKALEDIYSLTTTRRPRTTTRRPGPLMQSLNWLLNVLSPTTTTTRRPKPKSKKPKRKPKQNNEEILTHQPTHITPVVTPAPRRNLVSSLSQKDIQKLIKQLETIQKDPNNSESLDFSQIKSLQALLESEEGVKVTSSGTSGSTTRETTPLSTTTRKRKGKNRVAKSTTAIPLSVSNSIADEDYTTTSKARVTLPPVRLRPVPGIEDDGTMVRGQLITAAVNVTKAISSFLGTALQGAASSFQSLIGSGSRAVGSLIQSSNASARSE